MAYDVAAHALLSPRARVVRGDAVDASPAFLAAVDAAEQTLGLAGTAYAGEKGERAALAVVYRLNALLAYEPEAAWLSAKKQEGRSYTFRDVANLSEIDPIGAALAKSLLDQEAAEPSGAYTILTDLR